MSDQTYTLTVYDGGGGCRLVSTEHGVEDFKSFMDALARIGETQRAVFERRLQSAKHTQENMEKALSELELPTNEA